MKSQIYIAFLLLASSVFGQYTWQSTTTSFPPTSPFQQLVDWNMSYFLTGSLGWPPAGAEVSTTIIRNPGGISNTGQYNYIHLLGWKSGYDYNGGFQYWDGYVVAYYEQPNSWPPRITIYRHTHIPGVQSYTMTQLYSCIAMPPPTGTNFRSTIRYADGPSGNGAGIFVRLGDASCYFRDTTLIQGERNGIGMPTLFDANTYYSEAKVGNLETTPPNNITGLTTTLTNGVLMISWNRPSDNSSSDGFINYELFNNGVSLGTTDATTWNMAVQAGQSYTIGVRAFDGHRNYSNATTSTVFVPAQVTGGAMVDDSIRVGLHSLGNTWGALGESIDTRSMNLNYSIPLIKAQGRGFDIGLGLSYNSQNWRKENSSVSLAGGDVGYGFGWKLQIGSIFPVFSTPTTLSYYIFTDSSGARYKLDQQSGNLWSSKDGVYVKYNDLTYQLEMPNGTKWTFGSIAASTEADAGTRFPTLVQDRHGNQVKIWYTAGIGQGSDNTSSRIAYIDDVRSTQASSWRTFLFAYNNDSVPHLTGITNNINTAESFTLSYSTPQALFEPFTGSQQFGSAVRLNSLTQNGVNLTTSFTYNSSGEMTKLVLPLGGEMIWAYANQSYANGRQAREVQNRELRSSPGAATVNYVFSHPSSDSSLKFHSETTLADPSNVGQRRWTFHNTTDYKQGLLAKYEELDSWVVKSRTTATWANPSGRSPYISENINVIDVGLATEKTSKSTQNIDSLGNVTDTANYDYGNLTTALSGTSCIFNQTTVTYCGSSYGSEGISTGIGQVDTQPLDPVPADIRLWVNPNTTARKLLTTITDPSGKTTTTRYNLAGQPVYSSDNQGLSKTITYGGVGGSMVPTAITPNSNTALGTTMNWNGFLGLTNSTAGNGASFSIGYDTYGQPASKTTVDGAIEYYSRNVSTGMTQTLFNGRYTRTYHDGLGRPVRVESGYDIGAGPGYAALNSIVETEYEPCACSPLGKVKRVSLPYAPGGTKYWTTYTYDGLGRTISVALPNGAGTTTYLYEGNTVKVTTPAGKWKKYEMDVNGRISKVIEPRPGGGTYTTSYTYNVTGKVKSVNMARDGYTQTRTFTYDSTTQTRLLSATNPENGTVTYTYNVDGTTATRTDAKNIKTEYSYDSFKRMTQMRKLTQVSGVWTESRCERTDYFYDEGGGPNWGRLTRVFWNWQLNESGVVVPCATGGGFEERYQYNSAGRIVQKKLLQTKRSGANTGTVDLTANWTFNNEGQVTSITYPEHFEGDYLSRRQVQNTYDLSGRLSAVATKLGTQNSPSPGWQSVISNVQFNAFGAVTSLTHLGVTESRQYNILGQLTRLTKGTAIDVEYRYSATANDGKITSQKNWLTGEDVTYQYDELERLISAATTNNTAWGLSWQYDGFGNRLSQTVTQGSGPTHSAIVDVTNNRIATAGYSYDANGNMTIMPRGAGSMTLSYDLSNRVKSLSHTDGSEDYVYAPDNRRVWRSAGLTACRATRSDEGQVSTGGSGEYAREQLIFYSPSGQKLGTYCVIFSGNLQYTAISASEENVMYGSRIVGKRVLAQSYSYGNTALVEDFTVDRLHSKGGGSQFYPYGESKGPGSAGDDREQFATYTRDQKSGLDYADQRWYSSGLGRFISPDPFSSSASNLRPGTENRYSYVDGSVIDHIDPKGLAMRYVGSGYCTVGSGEGAEEVPCDGYHVDDDVPAPASPADPPLPAGAVLTQVEQNISFVGYTKSSHQASIVRSMLDRLMNNMDNECGEWLGGWLVSSGMTLNEFVERHVVDGIGVANSIYANGDTKSIINATQFGPDQGMITINSNGAFFRGDVNLGLGAGNIKSGSDRAKILLLLHELGHLVAKGFENDNGNPEAGRRNNERVREKCGGVLNRFDN